MGAVMAAVSPAVVVPRMIKISDEGYGADKGIPQMLVASSSDDDVFVIVVFSALLTMSSTGNFDFNIVWTVPLSIISGIAAGAVLGLAFAMFFKRFHMRDTVKIILLLSVYFLLVALEEFAKNIFPFSGLIAVVALGAMFRAKDVVRAKRISYKYEKLWVFAELLLFVLVGAEVDVSYAAANAGPVIAVMLIALLFRVLGVFASLLKTTFNFKEKLFCAIAYLPKATVQAAIGAIPLSVGLAGGEIILTCAVLSILITAPLGAFATDLSFKHLLSKSDIDNKPA